VIVAEVFDVAFDGKGGYAFPSVGEGFGAEGVAGGKVVVEAANAGDAGGTAGACRDR
jgi:hypothetical protein